MNVNYKCDSCNVIGELDEFYEHLDCPECGGMMHPLSPLDELTSDDFVPPEPDNGTISIPRNFIPKEKKGTGIKIATAVDLGFGGMLLSSSAAGKSSPVSSALASSPLKTASRTAPHPVTAPPSSPHTSQIQEQASPLKQSHLEQQKADKKKSLTQKKVSPLQEDSQSIAPDSLPLESAVNFKTLPIEDPTSEVVKTQAAIQKQGSFYDPNLLLELEVAAAKQAAKFAALRTNDAKCDVHTDAEQRTAEEE